MKVAIIGAGPAGITSGYVLSKHTSEVDVYEASNSVGGLSRTISLWNQKVDLGPHRFFSSDPEVNRLWLEVVGDDYEMVRRMTRIYYNNKFFYYPLKPFDALSKLGMVEAGLCMGSYLKQKMRRGKNGETFESWVTEKFGKRLFNIFFKTYSEKLWGISCQDLDSDFASQRIKKLSLFEAVKNAILAGKGNKHKTLVDEFAYPVSGTGMVYERMASAIREAGGNVFLNTPVHRVLAKGNKVKGIELTNGEVKEYDHVVSSMPLSLLVSRLPEVPVPIKEAAGKLRFRNTILVFLHVKATDLFPDNWLYVHSKDLKMGRITNFRNWVPQLYGDSDTTILALEYWCYNDDELWAAHDNELIELARKEVRKTRLVGKEEILDGFVYKIPRCYPVYYTGYKNDLKPVEDYLKGIKNLSVIGRYGAYKYNNQDHSILMGIYCAENLLFNKGHDLWEINTDYETYQENFVITRSGLVKQ